MRLAHTATELAQFNCQLQHVAGRSAATATHVVDAEEVANRAMLIRQQRDEHGSRELRQRLDIALGRLGARLRDEPELQQKIDDWVQRALGYVVDHYRGEVSEIISSTVAKWDGKATSERLELQVGRDLQFIRINGTIVGGMVGVLLHVIAQYV